VRSISATLGTEGINSLIAHLEAYKQTLPEKAAALRERTADHLRYAAQPGFDRSLLNDGQQTSHVSVSTRTDADAAFAVANGEQVAFIEFGAGVHYNGSAGASPHPRGTDMGLTIGSYGKGHGRQQAWVYPDGSEWKVTHGTPATMPMYHAMLDVEGEVPQLATEVFSR